METTHPTFETRFLKDTHEALSRIGLLDMEWWDNFDSWEMAEFVYRWSGGESTAHEIRTLAARYIEKCGQDPTDWF